MNLHTHAERAKYAIIVVSLILISVYLVFGTGRFALFSGVPFFVNVAYLTLSALLFIHLKRLFWVFFVFVLFLAFYAPVGLLYGELTEEVVLAIFGTFAIEAGELAKTFPFKHIAFSLISIILILYFYFATEKVSLKNRKIIIFLVLFVIITAFGQPLKIGTTSTFAKGIRYFKRSLDYMKLVNETKIEPKWQITSVSPKYKNFVVVIGESARRDYFEIYGYTVKNTPFLREINGTFVDGYTATGLNTIPALRHVLSHNADLNLNIVDLANLAGFETSWLSNQGTIGYHDTANTMVAQRAKFLYFISEDKSIKQKSDANLIKKVSEILNNESKNARVIFLHTYGSHFESCERLTTNEYKKYLGNITVNALSASDSVIVPVQCEFLALEGLSLVLNTVKIVKKSINPNLKFRGFLPTMYSKNNISKEVLANLKEHFEDKLFKSDRDENGFVIIPRNVKLAECPSYGKPVILYDIKSSGSVAYQDLANSIME